MKEVVSGASLTTGPPRRYRYYHRSRHCAPSVGSAAVVVVENGGGFSLSAQT